MSALLDNMIEKRDSMNYGTRMMLFKLHLSHNSAWEYYILLQLRILEYTHCNLHLVKFATMETRREIA